MTDVYEKLAQHLDSLPAGYPRTESGVEMRILKRLFSPEEAELATTLTMMPEPVAGIVATHRHG
jgi:electron transport complex protein RnfB